MHPMRSALALLLCLACALPVSASAPPWGVVSANPAENGMLVELRVFVEGATAVTLTLPPELQQIGQPTIEPGAIFVPLAVREWAAVGKYTIQATVQVGQERTAVSVPLRVVAATPTEPDAPPVWRAYQPLVVR